MHMHIHSVIGTDSPEKGFQKGSRYEKNEKNEKNKKKMEKNEKNEKNENPKVFRILTKKI